MQKTTLFLVIVVVTSASISLARAQHILPPRNIDGGDAVEAMLAAKLEAKMDLAFYQATLSEIVEFLKSKGIPMFLDIRGLDDIGFDHAGEKIDFIQPSIRLRDGLDLMLSQFDLAWTYKDRLIMVTTDERAENELLTKVYDVRNLVATSDYGTDFDSLIELLTSTVAVQSWDEVGGAGAVDAYETPRMRVLVISQTREVHEQVATALGRLAEFGGRTLLPRIAAPRRSQIIASPHFGHHVINAPRPRGSLRSSQLRSSTR